MGWASCFAILATYRKGDLDPAFLRRIGFIVDFLLPDPGERLRLWQLALPAFADGERPVTNGIDREWLATTLTLTGAEIKATALRAAYLACSRDELIGTGHVVDAARSELAKRGAVLRESEPRP